ncbi:hypothetical protein SDC9_169408 [bioreactor metagenome]|uniref:Uncharacterized protein n=1 Tax=bioreactor metagenome TaxID=1076179 RepID=A0A645G5U5_9ZZZZ
MAICHDQAVTAHAGKSFRCRTTVYCGTLTNGGVVADDGLCLLTLKLQILWNATNGSMRKDGTIFTDACTVQYCCLHHDPCSIAYFGVPIDICKGFHNHVVSQFGFRMYKSHR